MSPARFRFGPLPVRPARGEILLQEIRGDVAEVIAVGAALELPAADDLDAVLAHHLDAVLAHQTTNATLADTKAQLVQLLRHARSAVASRAQAVLIADRRQQHHVAPLTMRWRPLLPGPWAPVRHARQAAQMMAREASAIVGNILKLQGF